MLFAGYSSPDSLRRHKAASKLSAAIAINAYSLSFDQQKFCPAMFLLFPNLPFELRHEIWRHCIPAPRVIKTRYDLETGIILPGSAPPVLLHVCHESRKFLLCPEIGFTMQFSTRATPAAVCMNVKTDAVQIDHHALKYNDIKGAEFEAIIHLEIYGLSLHEERSRDVLCHLVKFPHLDTLSLVTHPDSLIARTGRSALFDVLNFRPMRTLLLTSDIGLEMDSPQYDAWKKPLLSYITTSDGGSRYSEKGEFNPAWSLVVPNAYTFAKKR